MGNILFGKGVGPEKRKKKLCICGYKDWVRTATRNLIEALLSLVSAVNESNFGTETAPLPSSLFSLLQISALNRQLGAEDDSRKTDVTLQSGLLLRGVPSFREREKAR